MTLPEVNELFEYWSNYPPESEILTVLARVYTTWEPSGTKPMTPEEHRESLERRWNSGQYMSPKQMLDAMGGKIRAPGTENGPFTNADMGGIGPFPG